MDAQELQHLLRATFSLPVEKRASYIREHIPGDPDTTEHILALLEESEGGDGNLSLVASELGPELVAAALAYLNAPVVSTGTRVGPFVLQRQIGRGGMGSVYLALRDDPSIKQCVAIKFLHPGLFDRRALARFQSEQQILARLIHPGIARFYDASVTEGGTPYYVMEYVEGRPITEYCDAHGLTVGERLRLFIEVCEAVQHAHQNLVVHRDLKPGNILVTAERRVKLLDFGIARLLEEDGADLTETRDWVLTLRYASPEHLTGGHVTTASDVYSLGVILYELLTGLVPHAESGSYAEVVRAVCDRVLIAPSGVVRTDGRRPERSGRYAMGSRFFWQELDAIVLKALRKEPARRYASPAALADDVRRYLSRRPVTARKDSALYRFRKFVSRYPVATLTVAILLAALLGAVGVAEFQRRTAASEKDRARAAFAALTSTLKENVVQMNTRGTDSLLASINSLISDHFSNEDTVLERSLDLWSHIREELGDVNTAIDLAARRVEVLEERGAGSQELASSLLRLAELNYKAGSPLESIEPAARTLALLRWDDPISIRAYHLLARVARETDRPQLVADYDALALAGYIRIEAEIDGRSRITLKQGTAQWHHFAFVAPGLAYGKPKPTLINDVEWFAHFPQAAGPQAKDCNCLSDVFRDVNPPLPSSEFKAQVFPIRSRATPIILDEPSKDNDFSLTLEINDNDFPGETLYVFDLVFAANTAPVRSKVLALDGDNDWVEVGHLPAEPRESLTVEFWMKPAGSLDGVIEVMGAWKTESTNVFAVDIIDGELMGFVAGLEDAGMRRAGVAEVRHEAWELDCGPVNADEWSHIAFSFQRKTFSCLRNGIPESSKSIELASLMSGSGAPMRIGNYDSDWRTYHGELDEVRVWNVARTSGEILSTINKPLTGNEAGLIGYWNFDDEDDWHPDNVHGHRLVGDAAIRESDRHQVATAIVPRSQ